MAARTDTASEAAEVRGTSAAEWATLGRERIAPDPECRTPVAGRPDSEAVGRGLAVGARHMATATLVVSGLRPSWR